MSKKENRLRRALKIRSRIKASGKVRLCVHRTSCHIYAQLISPSSDRVLVSASSLEKEVKASLLTGANKEAAELVGKRVAEKALQAGIKIVAFDRSGFAYHGRLAALAKGAREAGLEF